MARNKYQEYQKQELTLTNEELDSIKLRAKNEGIIAGKKHTKPSPETRQLFKTMELKLSEMKQEIKDELHSFKVEVVKELTALPEAIFEKGDDRWAPLDTKKKVDEICTKMEQRNYDWIKYVITAAVSAGLAFFFSKLK